MLSAFHAHLLFAFCLLFLSPAWALVVRSPTEGRDVGQYDFVIVGGTFYHPSLLMFLFISSFNVFFQT